MKIAIITINSDGQNLSRKLKAGLPGASIFNAGLNRKNGLKDLVKTIFNKYEGVIFIAALGITVRLIAGHIRSKFSDPAVVSIDTAGRFSISVLSGHEGGANRLAYLAAAVLGALPVITTGQDVHKKIIVGIGTRKGVEPARVREAVINTLRKKRIKISQVRIMATIELKKNEAGLIKACADMDIPLVFFPKESIANFKGALSKSEVVQRHLGIEGVCEPCALLAGRRAKLILKKQTQEGVAVAVAEEN